MTGFQAAPDDLRDLGKLVGRQADHATACQRYITSETSLHVSEGWLNDLHGGHDALVNGSREWFAGLSRDTLESAESAIIDSADFYEKTDAEAAADIDSQLNSYPTDRPVRHDTSYFGDEARPATFTEKSDPTAQLTEPGDYAEQGAWRWEPDWADYISVASAARGTFMKATELLSKVGWVDRSYDPYEWLVKPVTGDWAGFRGCADVFRNTAEACRSINVNLFHARSAAPLVWEGNAADGCEYFLAELCTALEPAARTLEQIAAEYETAAQGAFEFSKAVGSIISDLIDAITIFAMAAAGGTAFASTGIGLILGGGVAAYEGYRIVEMLNKLVGYRSTFNDIVSAVKAGFDDFGVIDTSGRILPRLPEAGNVGSPMLQLPK